jgi:hypothetical protein
MSQIRIERILRRSVKFVSDDVRKKKRLTNESQALVNCEK